MPQQPEHAVHVRPATPDDTEFILSLAPRFVAFELPGGRQKRDVLAAIRAGLERALRLRTPSDRFFIATGAHGEPAGFLHLQLQRDFFSGARTCHISDLAVATGNDGQGLGRALLAHAEKFAKRHRCKWLTLSVFPGNDRARALYERTGFAPDLLRMAKPAGRQPPSRGTPRQPTRRPATRATANKSAARK